MLGACSPGNGEPPRERRGHSPRSRAPLRGPAWLSQAGMLHRGQYPDRGRTWCRRTGGSPLGLSSKTRTRLPGRCRCDECVSGVHRPALGLKGGRRVRQLDVLGDVFGGEERLAGAVRSSDPEPAIGLYGRHDPPVTVLHPPAAASQATIVPPGDHQVAGSSTLALGYLHPRVSHYPGGDPISLRPLVQLGDRRAVAGDHETDLSGLDVASPGSEDGIEQAVPVALDDAAAGP